jgi:hypothetical protein
VRRLAWLFVFIPVAAFGCGDGSGETTSTHASEPLSKAQYLEVGDVICTNHRSRREDLESQARELGPLTSSAKANQVAGLLRKQARNLRAEERELASRRPASPDPSLVSFLSGVRTQAQALDRWAGAYDDLDERRLRRLQFRVGLIAAAAEFHARKYGFRACGR